MELVGGQAEAGEPVGQLVGVVGWISNVTGVNEHCAWFGSPEQEMVMNMGVVSVELFTGVMVTVAEPAVPAESVLGCSAETDT